MEYPMLDLKATGSRIKELRKSKNLKVEDVSRFMGFESPQAVYKWQRGESLPTVDNLYALSRLFETPVDNILRGKEERDVGSSLSLYCGIRGQQQGISGQQQLFPFIKMMFIIILFFM